MFKSLLRANCLHYTENDHKDCKNTVSNKIMALCDLLQTKFESKTTCRRGQEPSK